VYFQAPGGPVTANPVSVQMMLWQLDRSLERVLTRERLASPRQREDVIGTFQAAQNVLKKRLR
jgi:hypothetical protein